MIEQKLCVKCKRRKPVKGKANCAPCRSYKKAWSMNRYDIRKLKGQCTTCGKKMEGPFYTCGDCRRHRSELDAIRRSNATV